MSGNVGGDPKEGVAGIDVSLLRQLMQNTKQTRSDYQHVNRTTNTFQRWSRRRRNIIRLLKEAADELSKLHKSTRTGDQVGTSVSIIGNAVAIGGLVLMPFTAGMSASVALAGSTTALVGSTTSAISMGANNSLTHSRLKELEDELKQNLEEGQLLQDLLKTINGVMRRLNMFLPLMGQLEKLTFEEWKTLYTTVRGLYCSAGAGNFEEQWRSLKNLLQDDHVLEFLYGFNANFASVENFVNFISKNSDTLRLLFGGIVNGISLKRGIGGLSDAAPLSCTARNVQMAAHGVAIVFDAVHLINICTKTREPSHIQELRDYANELEKELEEAVMA